MTDILTSGQKFYVDISGTPVEFYDIMALPTMPATKVLKIPPNFNMPSAAWKQYDSADLWYYYLVDNPQYLYPPDLERAAGEYIAVP